MIVPEEVRRPYLYVGNEWEGRGCVSWQVQRLGDSKVKKIARDEWKEPRVGEEPERRIVSPYFVGAETVKRRVEVGCGDKERDSRE